MTSKVPNCVLYMISGFYILHVMYRYSACLHMKHLVRTLFCFVRIIIRLILQELVLVYNNLIIIALL